MTMLIEETGPVQSPLRSKSKDVWIDDAVYEIVEHFYPGQILPLQLRPKHFMSIMNCDQDEALQLWRAIRDHYSDVSEHLLIPHFCEYMGVDELFIHLFIASLKADQQATLQQPMPETPGQQDSNTGKPLLTPVQIVEKLRKGSIIRSRETLRERAITWKMLYPMGEPQYKRVRPYQVFIYADEIAAIYKIHLTTAQKMLREVREEDNMRPRAPVSIKKFCHYFEDEVDEDEIRKALASMYGEEE